MCWLCWFQSLKSNQCWKLFFFSSFQSFANFANISINEMAYSMEIDVFKSFNHTMNICYLCILIRYYNMENANNEWFVYLSGEKPLAVAIVYECVHYISFPKQFLLQSALKWKKSRTNMEESICMQNCRWKNKLKSRNT